MMSGPYQSNILRFLIGQYRAGVDRHHQAITNTRSTVVLGIEIGASVATTSVRGAVRVSRSAGQKLRQSAMNRRLLKPFAEAIGQLRSSSAGELVARSRLSATSNIELSETVGLVRTASVAVYSIAAQSAAITIGLVRTVVDWVMPGEAEGDVSAIAPALAANVVQSNSLRSSVAQFNSAQSSEIFPSQAQGSLVWSMRSFWIAVLQAIANLKPRQRSKRLKSAFVTLSEATAKALLNSQPSRQLGSGRAGALRLPLGDMDSDLRSESVAEVDLDAEGDGFLNAKVVAFEYVEHPLETVLKWTDRILTWIESQWRMLLDIWRRWFLGIQNS